MSLTDDLSPISPGTQPRASGSVGVSDVGTSRHMDPAATVPHPTTQIISNARGGFPQLEMVNLSRSPTKQRGDRTYPGGDKAWHVNSVVERLEGVSWTSSDPDYLK